MFRSKGKLLNRGRSSNSSLMSQIAPYNAIGVQKMVEESISFYPINALNVVHLQAF